MRVADTQTDDIGPFNRLSASQANTWEDCPRLWWYQNKMRLKFPQTPPLFLGRAVEECVCRVLLESPGLVFANAPLDVMANGADNLLPLFDDELPTDFMDWCEVRVDTHWPKIRDEMQNIIYSLDFKGDFESFINYLRTEKKFYVETPKELLMIARDISKRLDEKLPAVSYTHLTLPTKA